MAKFSPHRHRLYFLKRWANTLINVIAIILFILFVVGVYLSIRTVLGYVLSFDGYLGDVLSAIVSMTVFVLPLINTIRSFIIKQLNKLKQIIYIFLCRQRSSLLSKVVFNYNKRGWIGKPDQLNIISSALKILKGKQQGVFAIESKAHMGKTTAIMLLLDFIGKNIDLLDIFIALKNKILYYDGATEFGEVKKAIENADLLADSVLIIDNIHKLNSAKLTFLIDAVVSDAEFMAGIGKCCLILLLYQTNSTSKSLINELSGVRNSRFKYPFLLNDEYANNSIDKLSYSSMANIDYICGLVIGGHQTLRQHLCFLERTRTTINIIDLLTRIVDNQQIEKKDQVLVGMMVAATLIASFSGYVQETELKWSAKVLRHSRLKANRAIRTIVQEGFIIDFPLLPATYLYTEKLANSYKYLFLKNVNSQEIYNTLAEALFRRENDNSAFKWLYLVACSATFCDLVSSSQRKAYYSVCIKEFSVSYVLNAIEIDLAANPLKRQIFTIELGSLYIKNGQWRKARELLKPVVRNIHDQEEIWLLQLKIIEADHGTDDAENLQMLDEIHSQSHNLFISYLAQFWKLHIEMEQGIFDFDMLNELRRLLGDHREWMSHEYYSNTVRRLNSDCMRHYFLSGCIDYHMFQQIMELTEPPYIHTQNSDILTQRVQYMQAHYAHYDIIYQLGIWGFYKYAKIDPKYINMNLSDILQITLEAYDECVREYKSNGDKKWRTIQIRRDELYLCFDHCNYSEVIAHLNDFSDYSDDNGVNVFKGYCDTLRGKAFALYSISAITHGDLVRYDQYVACARDFLSNAKDVYHQYGNSYGVVRAELLLMLLEMLEKRSEQDMQRENRYESYFDSKFSDLLRECEKMGYHREMDVIGFLRTNIKQYTTCIVVLKYYPIILQ